MKKNLLMWVSLLFFMVSSPPAISGSTYWWCGGEGQISCLPIFACDAGAVAADLLCHEECGGDGEVACVFSQCDAGNSLVPFSLTQCTACGDQGQPLCLDDLLSPCDAWQTPNPANLLYCTACGTQGLPVCDPLNIFVSKCVSGQTPNPSTLFQTCTACGWEGLPTCGIGSCYTGFTPDPATVFTTCTSCGAEGQLPCQPLNPSISNCDDGLEVFLSGRCETCGGLLGPTCTPGPACDSGFNDVTDLVKVFGASISDVIETLDFLDIIPGVCVPCGQVGLPVCDEAPKCSPEDQTREYLGFCQYTGHSAEPTTNSSVIVPKQTASKPVWGFADVHEHQFGNEAYGGTVLWGKPFDPLGGGVNNALAWCDYTWDFKTAYSLSLVNSLAQYPLVPENLLFPIFTEMSNTDGRGYPIHGTHKGLLPSQHLFGFQHSMATHVELHNVSGVKGDIDITDLNIEDGLGITEGLLDLFFGDNDASEAWPNHKDGGHQQMYYKWLQRTYEGGLRLLVNMPVNNEILCHASLQKEGSSCDDMENAYQQINSIKALEDFIDLEDDGLDNNSGWYRIANSPQDARDIIASGAMAVILSIEVDSLFGCKPGTQDTMCDEQYIDTQLEKLYNVGVRHVFPVHLFDNAFAGAAFYSDFFSIANVLATKDRFKVYDCSNEGFDFKFSYSDLAGVSIYDVSDWINLFYLPGLLGYGEDTLDTLFTPEGLQEFYRDITETDRVADCNRKGLLPRGEYLLNSMMDKGMLIDIDHFSYRAMNGYTDDSGTFKGALDIFKDRNYPPISSHTVVFPELDDIPRYSSDERARTELGITTGQAINILKMGGLIAVNPPRDTGINGWEAATTKTFLYGQHKVFDEAIEGETKEIRTLGYQGILQLVEEAYSQHNTEWPDKVPLDPAYPRIGYAGDMGAFVPQPGPRFKAGIGNVPYIPKCTTPDENTADTCSELITGDESWLVYPFDNPMEYAVKVEDENDKPDSLGQFEKQVTGVRTFDFNTEGIAHVGMITDMLADARDNYNADLTPFFRSAEGFIQLWEQVYIDPDNSLTDADNDGIPDDSDNCPVIPNNDQLNTDADNQGNVCDNDDDNDGLDDIQDNCPLVANPAQLNWDADTQGDVCDSDDDNDTINDLIDACPFDAANDADNDGICAGQDVCPGYDDNVDTDEDGLANGCDSCPDDALNDADGDGVCGDKDLCANFDDAIDMDVDGIPDACDSCANDALNDIDGDGVCGDIDVCHGFDDNVDTDGDSFADGCDSCPNDALNDVDGDGVCGDLDICADGDDHIDADTDGIPDACDADRDGDGVDNVVDNCPSIFNSNQLDTDSDGMGNNCDSDDDNDNVSDSIDNCPLTANLDQLDTDTDGMGNACDSDMDNDGVVNTADNCPLLVNPNQSDNEADGLGDICDPDDDNDLVLDSLDNCPVLANPQQSDLDLDGMGDTCDTDKDGDGFFNETDNCPVIANPEQFDFDGDGAGDSCDPDDDNDGVDDVNDLCASTSSGALVDPATGCSIAQLVPCEGPRDSVQSWRNHGQYVSTLAKTAKNFVKLGLLTPKQKGRVISSAARSSCGKK